MSVMPGVSVSAHVPLIIRFRGLCGHYCGWCDIAEQDWPAADRSAFAPWLHWECGTARSEFCILLCSWSSFWVSVLYFCMCELTFSCMSHPPTSSNWYSGTHLRVTVLLFQECANAFHSQESGRDLSHVCSVSSFIDKMSAFTLVGDLWSWYLNKISKLISDYIADCILV